MQRRPRATEKYGPFRYSLTAKCREVLLTEQLPASGCATRKAGTDEHALIDAFPDEAIVAHGLSFGGRVTGGAVEKDGRGTVSPEQRKRPANSC
jgi:hypothetical protein